MTAHPKTDPRHVVLLAAERWFHNPTPRALHDLAQAAWKFGIHVELDPAERKRKKRREYMRAVRAGRRDPAPRLLKNPDVITAVEGAIKLEAAAIEHELYGHVKPLPPDAPAPRCAS